MTQQVARFFEAGSREHPQDWHMLQRVFTADLDPERLAARRAPAAARDASGTSARRGGWRAMRIGLVCPYTWDVPGGVQEHIRDLAEALIDLGHQVSVISPADEDEPRCPTTSCPPGARCRCPTTARWPGCRSASCPPAGCAAGSRRATSTSCTCTSPPRPACRCWPAGSPTARSWRPCTPRCRARGRCTPPSRSWQSALEKISGRIAVSEAARTTLVEHLGGDAVLIPNGVVGAPVREGRPAARLARRGRRARLPRPDGRAAQGPAGAAAGVRELGRGAARPAAADRRPGRRRGGRWTRCRPALRDRVVLLGQVSEEDKVRVLPLGRRVLRAQHRRRELRHRAGRGDGGRARRSWPATWTRSAGCCAAAGPASCSRTATRPTWPPRSGGCSTTRSGGPGCRRPPRPRCATTTGRWWPGTWCGSTRRWLAGAAGAGAGVAGGAMTLSDQPGHPRRGRDHRRLRVVAGRPARPAARPARGGPGRAGRRAGAAQLGRAGARVVRAARPGHRLLLAGAAHDARSARSRPGAGRERPDPGAAGGLRPAGVPRLADRHGGRRGAARPSWRAPRTRSSWPGSSTTTRSR